MHKRLAAPAILLGLSLVMSGQQPNGAGVNSPWTSAEVIKASDLAKIIETKSENPRIFHVGFAMLYKSKHIPGAIYAGPASKDEGLEALKKAVAGVSKEEPIVIYCGCCPWDQCPNMKPAYNLLRSLGYTKIKVVELPDNFATDWVEQGYPVKGGSASSK